MGRCGGSKPILDRTSITLSTLGFQSGKTLLLLGKLSSNLINLCYHDKVIAMKPFDFVCPPDHRYFPIFGQNSRVMAFFLCKCSNLIRKVKCLHKVLYAEYPFETRYRAMFNNIPLRNLWLQLSISASVTRGQSLRHTTQRSWVRFVIAYVRLVYPLVNNLCHLIILRNMLITQI